MLRELNWSGILFGSGAGLIVGIALYAIVGAVNGGTFLQVLIQFTAFFVAGYVAGRFSLVGAVAAGGFAGLFLYFGLALVSVIAGVDIQAVAILFFGALALAFGSAGAVLAQARRR
ncbi:MAG: hypothetical protein QNJ71_02615 [Acidimicrobiia bacterium]|nr:hypothetical protein [Acidimicrobiia bacterium]